MSENSQSNKLLREEINRYYEQGGEVARLTTGIGLLELARTKQLTRRFLPPPPAVIMDVGGGPGIYACWLARKGYEVHLVDAIALHVEQALQASLRQPDTPLASCRVGDARRLEYADSLAHVVLLYGPLYHLLEKRHRLEALRECRRMLQTGGLLLAVGISRFASMHVGLVRGWIDDPDFQVMVRSELVDGQHRPPQNWPGLFTTAHYHHPDELLQEVVEAGFVHEAILAVEGAGWMVPEIEERCQDPDQRATLLKAVSWTESEPSILGISPHIMVVARKQRDLQVIP